MGNKVPLIVTVCFLVIAGVGLSYGLPAPRYGIRVNQTASLPHRVFFSVKVEDAPISRGNIVAFSHPSAPIPLAKEVRGIAGDTVTIVDQHIVVNGNDLGEVLTASPSGRLLTPISTGTIPEGYVFVHSSHPLSYDSRYSELGLISIDAIEEILWPIF